MKSKKGLRDTGKLLETLKSDAEYKTVVAELCNLLKNAGNFNPITQGLTALAALVGKQIKDIEDKPLGAIIQSYTTLRGDFDNLGVNRNLYTTPKVDFTFKLIVQDASIQQKLSSKKSLSKKEVIEDLVELDMVPLK
jgi:hypothetical protein